jgi:hypothetical protein
LEKKNYGVSAGDEIEYEIRESSINFYYECDNNQRNPLEFIKDLRIKEIKFVQYMRFNENLYLMLWLV